MVGAARFELATPVAIQLQRSRPTAVPTDAIAWSSTLEPRHQFPRAARTSKLRCLSASVKPIVVSAKRSRWGAWKLARAAGAPAWSRRKLSRGATAGGALAGSGYTVTSSCMQPSPPACRTAVVSDCGDRAAPAWTEALMGTFMSPCGCANRKVGAGCCGFSCGTWSGEVM